MGPFKNVLDRDSQRFGSESVTIFIVQSLSFIHLCFFAQNGEPILSNWPNFWDSRELDFDNCKGLGRCNRRIVPRSTARESPLKFAISHDEALRSTSRLCLVSINFVKT